MKLVIKCIDKPGNGSETEIKNFYITPKRKSKFLKHKANLLFLFLKKFDIIMYKC